MSGSEILEDISLQGVTVDAEADMELRYQEVTSLKEKRNLQRVRSKRILSLLFF